MAVGQANLLKSINSFVKPTKNHMYEFINWIEVGKQHNSMKNFFIFPRTFLSIFCPQIDRKMYVYVNCELCALLWDARNVYEYEKIGKIE